MEKKKTLAVAISSVGRKTIFGTLDSILRTNEFKESLVEVVLFCNGIEDTFIKEKIKTYENIRNLQIQFGQTRLPIWESRRASLCMADSDFTWILGDDDQVSEKAFYEIFQKLDSSKNNNLLVTLNGHWSTYEGNVGKLSRGQSGTFHTSSVSEVFQALNATMNTIDVGRLIVSKNILDSWKAQPGTLYETWHEEYRALYQAILEISKQKNQTFNVIEIETPTVILGRVKKSWSTSYLEARLGQIKMLADLPGEFLPASKKVQQRERKFFFSIRHLISVRVRLKLKELPKFPLELTLSENIKVLLANRVPNWLVKSLTKYIHG